jgi:plastocyanin
MRRTKLVLAVASAMVMMLALTASVAGAQQPQNMMGQSTTPKTWKVAIEDFYFEPANAAIQPGDTIMWVNEGNTPHTVTADDGSFDSGTLQPGESYSHTFQSAGMVPYHCSIHPSMTGSVTVGAAAGGGGGTPMQQQPAAPAGRGMGSMGGY